ncbi:MAG: FimB/Mfa2 family fimbrial subunit, partial [Odoribacteraceae bacterium]|nr:FimB/Mfa2 family fimbrial subunit [Odoribacteraceae bacterium]
MKSKGSIHRGAIALLATVLSFASCIQDLQHYKEINDDEMALVTLSLSMPSSPATRSLAGTGAENAIAVVDVLLFNASDEFCYRAHGTKIEDEGNDPYATKKFEVRLPLGTYNVVVLANARAAISTSLPIATIVAGGASRANVLNGLESTLPADNKIENTNFPMWGHLASATITESTSSISSTIDLTRAVARVDVSVTNGVDFELTSARLYNYYNKGHVAPEATASNYNTTAVYPAGAKQEDEFVDYDIDESTSTVAFIETIYAFEAPAGTPVPGTGWGKNTCLVIGGQYDGGSETFYRVEFVNETDGTLALTRNHLYDVVIKQVSGH